MWVAVATDDIEEVNEGDEPMQEDADVIAFGEPTDGEWEKDEE